MPKLYRFTLCTLLVGVFFNAYIAHAESDPSKEAIDKAYAYFAAKLPGDPTIIAFPYPKSVFHFGRGLKRKLVDSDVVPGGVAVQLDNKRKRRNAWDNAAFLPVIGQINKGDAIVIAVWARLLKTDAEDGTNETYISLELEERPHTSLMFSRMKFKKEWDVYYLSGIATESFKPTTSRVIMHMGDAKKTVEFGPIFTLNLGPGLDFSDLP